MNRLLQRFVGDTSSQQQKGEADWAAGRAYEAQQPAAPLFYQQQQQHVATANNGLEDIPLSSPVSGSAGAFFSAPPAHVDHSLPQQLKQRHDAAADAFFQSEGLSPLTRPHSADAFSHSGARSQLGAAGSFFESSSASDPFASAPTSSRSAFDSHQDQQQTMLSTSGSVSDLFASPPRSTTPSFDGFDQQRHTPQHDNATLSTSSSSADLFANSPPAHTASSFYDGFAQQQPTQQQSDHGWATADELFASESASFHSSSGFGGEQQSPFGSAPGSFHGSIGGEQQQVRESSTPTTPAAAAAASTDDSSVANPFANPPRSATSPFNNSGADQHHFYDNFVQSPLTDPFATNSGEMFPSSTNTLEHQEQQQETSANPFASHSAPAESYQHANSTLDQQQQQQYDYQQGYYHQYHQYDYQHQQYDQQHQQYNQQHQQYEQQHQQYEQQHQQYEQQQHQQQQNDHQQHYDHQQQQYDHQHYYDNHESAASLFETPAPSNAAQADPFAGQSESNGYATEQQAHSNSGFENSQPNHGDSTGNATTAVNGFYSTPSPTQVNDFFSEAPPTPSASTLFDSHRSSDGASKPQTPVRQPSPLKVVQTSTFGGFSSTEAECEPFSEPLVVSATPTSTNGNQMSIQELNPVAGDDDADEGVEEVVRSLKKTMLDDSVKLVDMYKQMTERLEGEKNELLKVLADQADQFYQMQEYITSLEQELAAYRSQNK